jgi:hypothetical protein
MTIARQFAFWFVLSIPIACVSWSMTHEEVFREPREWCAGKSKQCAKLYQRKLFYPFTCEYCFSHYVTAVFLLLSRFTLLYDDWRGYVVSEFALVWLANIHMSIFNRLRLEIKHEKIAISKAGTL